MSNSLVEKRLKELYSLTGEALDGGYPCLLHTFALSMRILKEVERISGQSPRIYLNNDGSIIAAWQFGEYLADITIDRNREYAEMHYSPKLGMHIRKNVSYNHCARQFAKLYPMNKSK